MGSILSVLAIVALSLSTPSSAPTLIAKRPVPVIDYDTPSEPSPFFLDQSTIMMVVCPIIYQGKPDFATGTAFYLGNGRFVTARHVISDDDKPGKPLLTGCMIQGQPITILDVGKGSVDYALIRAPIWMPYRVVYSCNGFQQGRPYYASGFALSRPWLVTNRFIGTGSKSYRPGPGNNTDIVRGVAQPGTSGGPVSDEDGVIVGIMSAGARHSVPDTNIQSLADTPLCKK